jgi:hypothetical protein
MTSTPGNVVPASAETKDNQYKSLQWSDVSHFTCKVPLSLSEIFPSRAYCVLILHPDDPELIAFSFPSEVGWTGADYLFAF